MSSNKRLKELGVIIGSSPKGSKKYKDAMKELDRILGMPEEIVRDLEVVESTDDEFEPEET